MLKYISMKLLFFLLVVLSIQTTMAQQKKYTLSSYVEEHKSVAQQLMKETGVPASVILGVAIHESYYGNSRIAKHLNNHFGIKGKNSSKVIRSAYKDYSSIQDSYRDFIDLLKSKKSTQNLFDKYSSTDYKSWTLGIARSGYSATKGWRAKILATINRYNLSQYDEKI